VKVLGLVPARSGSRRVPGKNLRVLGEKQLVVRSIEACLGARSLSKIVVSSDDDAVLALASAFPVVALRRPAELSTDAAPAIDYVRHALEALEAGGERFDAVAIIQPSSPFTEPADIDAAVALLEGAPQADSAVTVMELDHAVHPVKMKTLDGTRLLPLLEEERGRMAAHELPKVYVRNCSVYVTRRTAIDRGEIIGNDSRGHLMPRARSVDINDELDWEFAKFLFDRRAT